MKKKIQILFIFSASLVVLLSGCRKDFDETVKIKDIIPEPTVFVETTVYGMVRDPDNKPLSYAKVSIGENEIVADRQGVFVFNNLLTPKYLSVVNARYFGYTTGHAIINTFAGDTGRLYLQLRKIKTLGSYTPGSDRRIIQTGSLRLTLDRMSFAKGDGSEYSDAVYVMGSLPKEADSAEQNEHLIARREGQDGILRSLASFSLSFSNSDGILQLHPGHAIATRWNINASDLDRAPDSIGLWRYDDLTDRWKETGRAGKKNKSYHFEISEGGQYRLASFSKMNYVSGTLQNTSGQKLTFAPLSFQYGNDAHIQIISTTAMGNYTLFLPSYSTPTMRVMTLCGETVGTLAISQMTNDIQWDHPEIIDDATSGHSFEGLMLDCDNEATSGGYVWVEGPEWTGEIFLTSGKGRFKGRLEACDDEKISLKGFDPIRKTEGEWLSLYLNDQTSEGLLKSCTNEIESFAYFIIEDRRINFTDCRLRTEIAGPNILASYVFEAKNTAFFIQHAYVERRIGSQQTEIWNIQDYTLSKFKYKVLEILSDPYIRKVKKSDGSIWVEFEITNANLLDKTRNRKIKHCRLHYFAPLK